MFACYLIFLACKQESSKDLLYIIIFRNVNQKTQKKVSY